MRHWLMAWRTHSIIALTVLAAACQTAQPPVIVSRGALPHGASASFTLAEGVVDAGWLSPQDVRQCLTGMGMQANDQPAYFVQYAVAIRSGSNTVSVGEPSAKPNEAVQAKASPQGDRILYKVLVDQLSDGARVFTLSIDAGYKAAKSTPASRAALLCSVLQAKAK
jgi:hypothetical protein